MDIKRMKHTMDRILITGGGVIDGRIEETCDRIKITVAFEVTPAEGEIHLNSENEAYGWFDEIPCNSIYNYAKYLQNY